MTGDSPACWVESFIAIVAPDLYRYNHRLQKNAREKCNGDNVYVPKRSGDKVTPERDNGGWKTSLSC